MLREESFYPFTLVSQLLTAAVSNDHSLINFGSVVATISHKLKQLLHTWVVSDGCCLVPRHLVSFLGIGSLCGSLCQCCM